MKHSIAIKFIAVVLCALSVVSIAACGFGILFMENWNLYNTPLDNMKREQIEYMAQDIAWYYAQVHATESLSNCPPEIINEVLSYSYTAEYTRGQCAVEIYEADQLVYSMNSAEFISDPYVGEYTITPNYPIISHQYVLAVNGKAVATEPTATETPVPDTTVPGSNEADMMESAAQVPQTTSAEWSLARDNALARVSGQDAVFSTEHHDEIWAENGDVYNVVYILDYYAAPEYTVNVYLEADAVLGSEYALMSVMYPYRDAFMPTLLISLLTFAITLVYICACAGHTRSGDIRPSALNRIPLDLYALGAGACVVFLAWLLIELLDNYSTGYYGIWDNIPLCMLLLGLGGFAIALLCIGFLFAFAAQVKVPKYYWLRHTVIGWCLIQIISLLSWFRRGLRYLYRGCRAVVRMLPVIWRWLLTAFLMVLVVAFSFFMWIWNYGFYGTFFGFVFFASLIGCVAIVCYSGWCFGTLLKGVKHMAQGNLNYQIPTKYLWASYREFAEQINSLAGAAQLAAERQTKSERMKTELITNVSHDIKTPLTSIINFVDLMKKPHTEAEREQYLEVLDRQSQRLKKLIDDLMEMSKASTGNLTVEIGRVDAAEAINQALGEFSDKLERVNLTPIFRHPDTPVTMMADGRLIWRILSNILSNAVKYALPDTRLYIDLMVLQGNAVIAIKNISRDQLNMGADELMERFVRGDASRNTEGSGLGLNIAKSLVELQHGQMHLMVDGDLFKVTLIFPTA